MPTPATPPALGPAPSEAPLHPFRFHAPHLHLAPVFGSDSFGMKAEAFARYFGTPRFLLAQTILVAIWIALNGAGAPQTCAPCPIEPFRQAAVTFSIDGAA